MFGSWVCCLQQGWTSIVPHEDWLFEHGACYAMVKRKITHGVGAPIFHKLLEHSGVGQSLQQVEPCDQISSAPPTASYWVLHCLVFGRRSQLSGFALCLAQIIVQWCHQWASFRLVKGTFCVCPVHRQGHWLGFRIAIPSWRASHTGPGSKFKFYPLRLWNVPFEHQPTSHTQCVYNCIYIYIYLFIYTYIYICMSPLPCHTHKEVQDDLENP